MQPKRLPRLWLLILASQLQCSPFSRAADEAPVPPNHALRTPEELLVALSKCNKPDWASKYRPPIASAPTSRAQIALLLGSLFAEGYLAAQAEDSQHCRNVGKDITTLSKTLGVQAELLDRSRSLADCAQKRDWPLLRRELESTESDLEAALRKHEDAGLAYLVSLGAWMRGTEIASAILKDNYTDNAAQLLRQPVLNRLLETKFETLSQKIRTDPVVVLIQERLSSVALLLNGPSESIISHEEVGNLAQTLHSIFQDITSRPN
jgi:hypothetical protein